MAGGYLFFCIMRGNEMICYARAEGSFPIRTLTLNAGTRRPLGVGSGGLAIAAFLSDERIAELLEIQREERQRFGVDDAHLLRGIAETRELGYAFHKGLFAEDMGGLAVPVRNSSGDVVASVTVNALRSRLEVDRRPAIAETLRREVARIEKDLANYWTSSDRRSAKQRSSCDPRVGRQMPLPGPDPAARAVTHPVVFRNSGKPSTRAVPGSVRSCRFPPVWTRAPAGQKKRRPA